MILYLILGMVFQLVCVGIFKDAYIESILMKEGFGTISSAQAWKRKQLVKHAQLLDIKTMLELNIFTLSSKVVRSSTYLLRVQF